MLDGGFFACGLILFRAGAPASGSLCLGGAGALTGAQPLSLRRQLQPEVPPQVLHFMQVPLRTSV